MPWIVAMIAYFFCSGYKASRLVCDTCIALASIGWCWSLGVASSGSVLHGLLVCRLLRWSRSLHTSWPGLWVESRFLESLLLPWPLCKKLALSLALDVRTSIF